MPHLNSGIRHKNLIHGNCWVQGSKAEAQRDLWPEGKVQALSQEELSSLASSDSREQDTLVVLYAPWCQFSQVSGSFDQHPGSGHCALAFWLVDTP